MKKALAIALLSLLVLPVVMAAAEWDVSKERAEYRYTIIYARAEAHRIGMEAVMDQLGDNVTDDLQAVYDDFVGYYDDLSAAKDASDLDAMADARDEMVSLAADFRTEARTLLGNDTAKARAAVTAALDANEAELAANEKDVYDAHVAYLFKAFDNGVIVAEDRLAKLEERGIDTTSTQAQLDEIVAARAELQTEVDAAYASCIGNLVLVCGTEAHEQYVEYRHEVHSMFKEMHQVSVQAVHLNWIESARNRVENAETRLANTTGADVTEAQASLTSAQIALAAAETAVNSGDFAGARASMQTVRSDYVSAVQSTANAVKEARAERVESKKNTATTAPTVEPTSGGEAPTASPAPTIQAATATPTPTSSYVVKYENGTTIPGAVVETNASGAIVSISTAEGVIIGGWDSIVSQDNNMIIINSKNGSAGVSA